MKSALSRKDYTEINLEKKIIKVDSIIKIES